MNGEIIGLAMHSFVHSLSFNDGADTLQNARNTAIKQPKHHSVI